MGSRAVLLWVYMSSPLTHGCKSGLSADRDHASMIPVVKIRVNGNGTCCTTSDLSAPRRSLQLYDHLPKSLRSSKMIDV